MKEMTIEQKARAYDEALERARKYWESPRTCFDINALTEIFSELKEREEEEIKKDIVAAVETYGDFTQNRKEEIYTWLERQAKENMIEALRLEYEKGKADRLQEQRKEWNEEDERIKKNIKVALLSMDDNLKDFYYAHHTSKEECVTWLERQGKHAIACSEEQMDELENEYLKSIPKY